MKAGVIYRGVWVDTETDRSDESNIQREWTIDISDNEELIADDADELIIPLEMSDDPCRMSVIDNSEEPFTQIRATQLAINIHTGEGISIATFAFGNDARFSVHLYDDSAVTHFRGILSMSDLQQEFQPDPNILSLTATDGLGFLNDIPLTDFDGEVPQNENAIMEYIAWCLSKKGWDCNINVIMNLRHEGASELNADADGDGHFYKYISIDAKTFETEIGECEDCYTVLQKIFGDNCEVFTKGGEVWIKRIDEIEHGKPFYVFTFDSTGAFVSKSQINPDYSIGIDLAAEWMNDDATVLAERLRRRIIETFRYENWRELVCNLDFSRGDGSDPVGTTEDEQLDDNPECIDFFSEGASGFFTDLDDSPEVGATGVRRRIFDFGVETDRYLIGTAVSDRHYFKMQPFYVQQGDKIDLSVDTRTTDDEAITNLFPVVVTLIADDGSYYTWHYDADTGDNEWVAVSAASGWFLNTWEQLRTGEDTREWKGIGTESLPVPESGKVFIRLVIASAGIELWFANLRISLLQLINGSYQRYTGHQHIVTQDVGVRNERENQVYINDSPNRNFKGTLLRRERGASIFSGTVNFGASGFSVAGDQRGLFYTGQNLDIDATTAANDGFAQVTNVQYNIIGNTTAVTLDRSTTVVSESATIYAASFVLANRFYSAHVYPDTPPAEAYNSFGRTQAFDVWNQFNRVMARFDGQVDGTAAVPTLLDRYLLTDSNVMSNNRIFHLLHFEVNLYLNEWTAFLAEAVNSDVGKVYTGYTFKMLTQ